MPSILARGEQTGPSDWGINRFAHYAKGMSYKSGRPGLEAPTGDMAERVRRLVKRIGPMQASACLGVSRDTVIAIGCECPVLRGSLALVGDKLDAVEAGEHTEATIGAE